MTGFGAGGSGRGAGQRDLSAIGRLGRPQNGRKFGAVTAPPTRPRRVGAAPLPSQTSHCRQTHKRTTSYCYLANS